MPITFRLRARWHRNSEFGPGPRQPLDREQRAVWRARVELARRAGRITALHAQVGLALLRRLGQDGRLDPSHATLAADAGVGERTVRRALAALAGCGLLRWVRRLARDAASRWRATQISSAYALSLGGTPGSPGGQGSWVQATWAWISTPRATACGGHVGRATRKEAAFQDADRATVADAAAARRTLAEIAARRLPEIAQAWTQRQVPELRYSQ